MTDEAQQAGTEDAGQDNGTPAPAPKPSAADRKLEKENESLKKRLNKLQSAIDKQIEEANTRKEQDMESAGQHEQVKAELKSKLKAEAAERERLAAEYEAKLARKDLIVELANKGCVDDIIREGMIARFDSMDSDDRPSPDQFAVQMAEAHPGHFGAPSTTGLSAPSAAAPPAAQASTNTEIAELKAALNDPQKASAAMTTLTEMAAAGKLPDGFSAG